MLVLTMKRMLRAPLPQIAVLLFATAVSIIICTLHAASQEELRNYENVYQTIPVELTVTNLSATRTEDLEIPSWYLSVFTSTNTDSLAEYVKDVQVKSSHAITAVNGIGYPATLVGITSITCDEQLFPENGCSITWLDGYDETIFAEGEALCIVPKDLLIHADSEEQKLVMDFSYIIKNGLYEEPEVRECYRTFTVAGTYLGGDGVSVYCPYPVVEQICRQLRENQTLDSLSATLSDNDRLEEMREKKAAWFATPNPLGEKTEWGDRGYYDFALDIDDALLVKTAAAMENSMAINRACTLIVYVISAAAGFLIGFLMIRNRKREIALIRTMGAPQGTVYFEFALEQMVCVILGIILGGANNQWQPTERLGILAATYFVGLTIALLIFLRKNLLTTIKEDE